MKIISVVGARPNFMKIAPFIKAIQTFNATLEPSNFQIIEHLLVHTGQHYDDRMSKSFSNRLEYPMQILTSASVPALMRSKWVTP